LEDYDPKANQTDLTGSNGDEPTRSNDDVIVPGDRLLSKVAWDLRDEHSEDMAYESAVNALTDRDDFDQTDVDALEVSLREQFGPDRDEHAFTPKQRAHIAEQFEFTLEQAEALSKAVAIELNPTLSPFVLHVPRQVSINRATAKLKEVEALLFKACDLMTQALEIAETLDTAQANDRDGAEKLNKLRREHEEATRSLEALHRKYSILRKRPDCALDLSPENRRKISDERRKTILFCIFDFWAASGRSLTTTTADSTRKGPLYEFVNAIVVCLTVRGVALSGHTIFDDLKDYKAANKLP
jgi:hypothetical protein